MPLNQAAIAGLSSIQQNFGAAAYQDFLKIVNASPDYQNQLNAYFESRQGQFSVSDNVPGGGAGSYVVDRSLDTAGNNSSGGAITISSIASDYTKSGNWSVGYGIAETIAHELGHAFDPGLGSTAQNNAAQEGANSFVQLNTQSEALAEVNSYNLMSQARSALLASNSNTTTSDPTQTLFSKTSDVTAFGFAEQAASAYASSPATYTDLANTCTASTAMLATHWPFAVGARAQFPGDRGSNPGVLNRMSELARPQSVRVA